MNAHKGKHNFGSMRSRRHSAVREDVLLALIQHFVVGSQTTISDRAFSSIFVSDFAGFVYQTSHDFKE